MTALLQSPGLVGPITFWQVNGIGNNSVILTEPSNVGQRLILCWMSLVARQDQAGSVALITLNGVAIHSGQQGSGIADRFPLDCLISVNRFDIISLTTTGTGHWDTVGVGYYAPAYNIA